MDKIINNLFNKTYKKAFFFFASILVFKEIIVFNEETLVAISFILFIYFAYNMLKDTIRIELEEKANTIEKELDAYWNIKTKALETLISEYEKQLEIEKHIQNLSQLTQITIQNFINKQKIAYFYYFYKSFLEKYKYLYQQKQKFVNELQQQFVSWILYLVEFEYKQELLVSKTTNIQSVKDAISQLNVLGINLNQKLPSSNIIKKEKQKIIKKNGKKNK
jgi:F0F1-type ATP synthase membrane subunit b/b'